MAKILGVAGSLRKGSFNQSLLLAAQERVGPGNDLIAGSISGIPLYDADEETANGLPDAVVALKDQIASADGLLLVTPEYNNSIPGVFKNAIDWASRPAEDIGHVFGGRPVAIMGASPGGFGTLLSQDAWLTVLRTLGTKPWFEGRLLVSRAHTVFDGDGQLTDDEIGRRLELFLEGFVAFIRDQKP